MRYGVKSRSNFNILCKSHLILQLNNAHMPLNPFEPNGISHSSIGLVHFHFKGCWLIIFIFIQIVIEHSVSK